MSTTKTLGFIAITILAAACGGSKPETTEPTTPTAVPTTAPTTPETPATASATPPAPAKPAAKPEDTTKALVDAWNAHDVDKVVAAYADAGALKLIGMPPGMGDFSGKDAIKAETADTLKAYPDFKVAVTRVTMKGNVAAVEWVITGTNTGDSDMMKMKATGRKMGVHGVDIATFDDAGLIKEAHRYFDAPTQMMQLDAKAKAGTFRPVETLPTAAPTVLTSAGTPEEQKNLDAANAAYKTIDEHKVDPLIAMMSPEASMDDYTQPKAMVGAKDMKAFFGMVFKAIPDVVQDKATQMAAGDLVVTEGYLHGTMKGAMGPMKATNKPIGMHFVDVLQFKDGKMVKGWSYGNSMEMMPPPAPKAEKPAAPPAKGDKPAAPKK